MSRFCRFINFYHLLLLLFLIILLKTETTLSQGYLLCIGGGSENYNNWSDEPYGWFVEKADSGKILILHYDQGSTWLEDYFKWLGAKETESLVIPSRTEAKDSINYNKIINSNGVFLRGGDQWNYVSTWDETLTEDALWNLFQNGGVIGGTSAGLAVLGEVDFVASNGSAYSNSAIRNPFYSKISLANSFLPLISGVIFDSHFTERGRFGRLLAMMNFWEYSKNEKITGVGIDDRTALCIEPNGIATVMGSGSVFFYSSKGNASPPGQSLFLDDVSVKQGIKKFVFDFNSDQFSELPSSVQLFQPDSINIKAETDVILVPGISVLDISSLTYLLQHFSISNNANLLILTDSTNSTLANTVKVGLENHGFTSSIQIEEISENRLNDSNLSDKMNQTDVLLFVDLDLEKTPGYFNFESLVGTSWYNHFQQRKLVVFIGDDTKLAGPYQILETESSKYAAYRGQLFSVAGLNLLQMLIIPKVFDSSDYDENRTDGLLWGLAFHQIPFGLYLDEDCAVAITQEGKVITSGDIPVMLIDARNANYRDFSTWQSSSNYNPRQSVALGDYGLKVFSQGYEYDISSGKLTTNIVEKHDRKIPIDFDLSVYPNPTMAYLNIKYSINTTSSVSIKLFNSLGKEIWEITNITISEGSYLDIFRIPHNLPSSCYFLRLNTNSQVKTVKILFLKNIQ